MYVLTGYAFLYSSCNACKTSLHHVYDSREYVSVFFVESGHSVLYSIRVCKIVFGQTRFPRSLDRLDIVIGNRKNVSP